MLRVLSPQPGGFLNPLARAAPSLLGSRRRLPTAMRRRKKSRGPARPRRGLATPLLAHQEALEKEEDFAAGPTASLGPAPRLGEEENSGGCPQAPSGSHDQEEGPRRCGEGPRRCGEGATAWLETEEHLEEVGDGQKQPSDSPSRSPQDREFHGAGGEPEGGLKLPGGDTPSCPQSGPDLGHAVTRNPHVRSLFYCPSEEDDEAGDWPSEEEGDDGGGCSGADWPDSEEDTRREENKALWGALCCGQDPFNPLRWAGAPLGSTPPRPKDQKFRVSFYLCGLTLEAEKVGDPWKPPEKPWPMRRGVPSRTHCCELGSRGARDPVKAETSDSEGNRTAKKVQFSPVVTVHPLLVWPFASRAARQGPWEELARDRSRFAGASSSWGPSWSPAWTRDTGPEPGGRCTGQDRRWPSPSMRERRTQGRSCGTCLSSSALKGRRTQASGRVMLGSTHPSPPIIGEWRTQASGMEDSARPQTLSPLGWLPWCPPPLSGDWINPSGS
ncbi:unnamed protein product [Caretta caretta]